MIEVTDEMVHAFIRAYSDADDGSSEVILSNAAEKAGLAAVLAIVERDHRERARCCPSGDAWCASGASTCSRCVLDRVARATAR